MIFKNIFSINSPGGAFIEFRLKWGGISDFKYIKEGVLPEFPIQMH